MLLLLGGKSGWGLVVVPEADTPSPHLPTTTLRTLESILDKKARDASILLFDVNVGSVNGFWYSWHVHILEHLTNELMWCLEESPAKFVHNVSWKPSFGIV